MRTIVSKFGGSSTASAAQLQRIAMIVRASPARRCVVLSAPGIDAEHPEKITAQLERCWRERNAPHALEQTVDAVARRFGEIADALGVTGFGAYAQEEILRALYISEAETLSRGEYLCALLFSLYTGIPMADAAGLIFFDGEGGIDEAKTRAALRACSKGHGPVVIPGFYGSDPEGHIRVFPRNGSDISGALAAVGMDAALYENWTDVPGLMTADPAVVPSARLIPQVSYRRMRALARAGAQVLHPACLDPVAMAGIPTQLRPTDRPECFGTLIDDHVADDMPCIAGKRDGSAVDGSPAAVLSVFGVGYERVCRAARGVSALSVERLDGGARVCVSREDYGAALRALHRDLIE